MLKKILIEYSSGRIIYKINDKYTDINGNVYDDYITVSENLQNKVNIIYEKFKILFTNYSDLISETLINDEEFEKYRYNFKYIKKCLKTWHYLIYMYYI